MIAKECNNKKSCAFIITDIFFWRVMFSSIYKQAPTWFPLSCPINLRNLFLIQTYAQSKQIWCQDAICMYINYCIHLHTLDLRCSYKIIPYGSKHVLKLKHLYKTPISSIKILRYRFDTLRKSNQIKKRFK